MKNTNNQLSPGKYLVTLRDNSKCIIDHFWIVRTDDGKYRVSGIELLAVEPFKSPK